MSLAAGEEVLESIGAGFLRQVEPLPGVEDPQVGVCIEA